MGLRQLWNGATMTTDYAKLTEENIFEYGHAVKHVALLTDLYPERGHFIWELLQNAEDAGASTLRFSLSSDRLELRHDGRPFAEADVRSICKVAESAKLDDPASIGRFGIGFKSVYSCTRTPRISSGDEAFMINDYTRPAALHERIPRRSEETAFVLPFDHPDVPADLAHRRIRAALADLRADALLFLSSIRTVEIIDGDHETRLARTVTPGFPSRVSVTTSTAHEEWSQRWWLVEAPVAGAPAGTRPLKVALLRSDDDAAVVPVRPAPLSVVFPTAAETGLSFLVDGPFRTTPARDNVTDDDWNRGLVLHAGDAVVDALHALKGHGLLTVDVLGAMPLAESRTAGRDLFRPLHTRIREALRDERLLPTARGGFAAATDLRRPARPELREFVADDELTLSTGGARPLFWLHPDLTSRASRDLSEFLSWAGVGVLTTEDYVGSFGAADLAARSDEWLTGLYALVEATASPSRWSRAPHWAEGRPLVRLTDGSHVSAVDEDGHPLAHLPAPGSVTRFATVKESIAANPAARAFLESLGVQQADVTDDLRVFVLFRYASGAPLPSDDVVRDDLRVAAEAVGLPGERARVAASALRSTAFLRCTSATGEQGLRRPGSAYHRSPDLEAYFAGNPDAWFPDAVYDPWSSMLRRLGVADAPRVVHRHDPATHITLTSFHGRHERGLRGFHPGLDVDGLEHALHHPTTPSSAYIWSTLLPGLAPHLDGVVERSTRQTYSDSTRTLRTSTALDRLRRAAWLPDGSGGWLRPAEATRGSLPSEFTPQPQLDRVLGLREDVVAAASAALGVDASSLQYLRDNPDVIQKLVLDQARSAGTSAGPDEDDQPVRAGGPGAQGGPWNAFPTGGRTVDRDAPSEPILDLARAATDHGTGRHPGDSSRSSERRVWSPRDSALRRQLVDEYEGACQICGAGFLRADDEPYIEVQHLRGRSEGSTTDVLGGVLCLCPTCRCKLVYGAWEPLGQDVVTQVLRWGPTPADGAVPAVELLLCGEQVRISFTARHAEAFRRERLRVEE